MSTQTNNPFVLKNTLNLSESLLSPTQWNHKLHLDNEKPHMNLWLACILKVFKTVDYRPAKLD